MQSVALYLRISRDPAGRVEGVNRQEQWGRAYAEAKWPTLPVEVFADNNLSADEATHRPQYEALRAAIRKGGVRHLWVVEQSRLTRVEIHWFELAADLLEADVTEIHTDRDGIVRLDEVAGIKAVLAAAERRRLRRRVNDTLASLADEGRPSGGHGFGYRRGVDGDGRKTLTPIPEHADAVRWAADAVLSGWSLSAVARELEDRKIPTRLGGRWTHGNVRGMLTAPVVAGFRTYRGEIVRRGNWEPILDEGTWRRVGALLEQGPRSVTRPDGSLQLVTGRRRPARSYLLTGGTARCGRDGCGAGLVGRRRTNSRGVREPIYFCDTGHGGCGRLGVNAEPFESHVTDRLLERLATPEVAAMLAVDDNDQRRDALTRRLGDLKARGVSLAKRWAAGDLDDAAWDAARVELDDQREASNAELAALAPRSHADPADVLSGWDHMTLAERRLVVDLWIAAVTVEPATPGARQFDPGRVRIDWREPG